MPKVMFRSVLSISTILMSFSVAQAATDGTWTLYPPQATAYRTTVQQPINVDGTSNFKGGKSVIPIKFSLAKSKGPVVFQSIFSDDPGVTANNYSFLTFRPANTLTFPELTNLSAVYAFNEGNCHGGALRWEVGLPTGNIFIYYGGHPNFTDCTTAGAATNQSGLNMLSFFDLRFDTSQIGGTFYDSYADALALAGSNPVDGVALVLDGGWAGDQRLTPSNVTVNDNTFVPGGTTPVPTCTLPSATIQITKISGAPTGNVNEPVSVQPFDNNKNFRVVDCKYMYNLSTSSLPGAGRYRVEAIIGGSPAAGAAEFDVR